MDARRSDKPIMEWVPDSIKEKLQMFTGASVIKMKARGVMVRHPLSDVFWERDSLLWESKRHSLIRVQRHQHWNYSLGDWKVKDKKCPKRNHALWICTVILKSFNIKYHNNIDDLKCNSHRKVCKKGSKFWVFTGVLHTFWRTPHILLCFKVEGNARKLLPGHYPFF